MTDRVYPSSKPNGKTKTKTTTGNTKPTSVAGAGATKPSPRLPPPPPSNRRNPTTHHRSPRRSRRSYFCTCCFWSVLIIILLLLIAAVAGCILYLLYRPHRPTFSVTAVKLSRFSLTTAGDDTTRLNSKLNVTISTKNPNKKIIFYYDSIVITCLTDETQIAKGSFANPFISNPNNITIIRSSLSSNSLILETETLNQIRTDLKKKSGLPLKILLDTKARVKIESFRSKKIGIRIKCEGIHSHIPSGNSTSVVAAVSDAKCKLDLRIKIWKWTF